MKSSRTQSPKTKQPNPPELSPGKQSRPVEEKRRMREGKKKPLSHLLFLSANEPWRLLRR